MNPQRLVSLLLVTCILGIAGPLPASGQSGQSGQSEREEAVDNVVRERTAAFCNYYAELKKAGKPVAAGDLSFPGFGGSNWVFKASEVQALMKRCDELMKLMQQVK